ncbi:MAG: Crp/Fnr family transcriptional regulator [Bacteroidales bacterium]|nr:Crp/Fnr family transcriptional regulator [Bacteroidales bacterium]
MAITKGDILVHSGELAKKLFFIHEGVFRYYLISPDGKEITKDFAVDKQNPFCMAFSSFMTNQPSQISIDALTNSKVSVWDRSYFFPLISQNIHWLPFSQRITMGMFIRKEKKEISLIRDAPQRYLTFKNEFPCLLDRIPQHYIASYLNIAPESLSRIKKNLKP